MDESSNTLETFLTEQQLAEYKSKEYPFNTNFLGTILKEKLKQDPDYEVWVPFFYCQGTARRKNRNTPSIISVPFVFISNKGRVYGPRRGKGVTILSLVKLENYPAVSITTSYQNCRQFTLHRSLGTVFVPLPEELKLLHPKDLEVNHIDGNKDNFELSNLEWATKSGNALHAVATGLQKSGKDSVKTKPVKGRVEFGSYKGYEFILYGHSDYKKYGFVQPSLNACCRGRLKTHKNCSWSYATDDEVAGLPRGVPEHVQITIFG